jgi:predicted mannosyl-3-phosphoglycerate phosphatase (HAD superfamily)
MFNAERRENILREKLKDKRIKFKVEQRIYEIYGRQIGKDETNKYNVISKYKQSEGRITTTTKMKRKKKYDAK